MKFNPSKSLFMFMLIISILITLSSNSWLGIWMGLEMNLLSFIPLMIDNKNSYSSEAALKYFLTQTMASSIFLFSIIFFLNLKTINFNIWNYSTWISLLFINFSMLIKAGSAPFHFWFPSVMNCLSWFNNWILMTFQKISPFIIIFYSFNFYINMISLILSLLIGALGGFNQTSLRKIMAYSSINHLSWMLSSMFHSKILWMNYFMFYFFLTSSIILLLNFFNIFFINQLFLYFNKNLMIKFSLFSLFFSLSGIPPFLGFFPKWMIIEFMIHNNFIFILLLLVTITLLTLYFYLQITYSAFLINSWNMKWNFKFLNFNIFNYQNLYMYIIMFISIFGLIMISIFFN